MDYEARLHYTIDGVTNTVVLKINQVSNNGPAVDLVTPPDFRLDVPPGATFTAWLELTNIDTEHARRLPIKLLPEHQGWDIADVLPLNPDSKYTMSAGVRLEASVADEGASARRVLDSRYLSHYEDAERLNVPFKNEKGGLDWAPLLRQVGGGNSDAPLTFTVIEGIFYQ